MTKNECLERKKRQNAGILSPHDCCCLSVHQTPHMEGTFLIYEVKRQTKITTSREFASISENLWH